MILCSRGRIYTVCTCLLLLCSIPQTTCGQTFGAVGFGAGWPTSGYGERSPVALNGELQYGVHRYCNWWPVATLNYGYYSASDTLSVLTPAFPHAVTVQGNLRWFPWGSTTLPLYASLGTGLSVVIGADDKGVVGMPGTAEIGYLLFYSNPCCDWFLTLSMRYTALNMLRDLDRPHLSALSGIIHVSLPLGRGGK